MRIEIEPASDHLPDPLPQELGFGRLFTNRMFSQRFSLERGWHDAQIGPYRALSLDPAAEVFHCGQMVFEGTKAYRRPDGHINLFRIDRNAERFNRSAQRMGMPSVAAADHIEAIARLVSLEHRWVPQQQGSALYIRPVMIALERSLEVRASREYLHYIILSPVAPYFAHGFAPVSVYVSEEYVRTVRGGTGEAKTPGNYAGSLAATEDARARGYQQVLWLDGVERRYIDEVGAMNIAFIYEGSHLRTPALSGAILQGVTRDSVLRLAPELGVSVSEERMDMHQIVRDVEAGRVTEAFCMGTGAVIAPVGRLGFERRDLILNGNQPGPIARRVYEELTGIQYGRIPDRYGWTTTLQVPEPAGAARAAGSIRA